MILHTVAIEWRIVEKKPVCGFIYDMGHARG